MHEGSMQKGESLSTLEKRAEEKTLGDESPPLRGESGTGRLLAPPKARCGPEMLHEDGEGFDAAFAEGVAYRRRRGGFRKPMTGKSGPCF